MRPIEITSKEDYPAGIEADILKHSLSKRNIFFTILSICVIGYFSLVPSIDLIPALGSYNTQRVLQLCLLAGTACLLIVSRRFLNHWLNTWYLLPKSTRGGLGAFLLLGIISSINSLSSDFALLEVSVILLLFVFTLLIAGLYQKYSQLVTQLILGTILLCVFFYSIKFFTSYLFYHFVDGAVLWPAGDMVLGFSHVRFFNQIQTWTLPLLIISVLLLPPKYVFMKWGIAGLTAIWWMLVFAADGRGTIIASIFALISVAILYRKEAFTWFVFNILAAGIGFVLYVLLFQSPVGEGSEELIRFGDSGRMGMWKHAGQLIAQEPLLGIGPMHYAHIEYQFSRVIFGHPHNSYLQFAAEWGLIAFLILFTIIIYGFYALLRQNFVQFKKEPLRNSDIIIRIGLTASLVAGAVHALVSGLFIMPMSQMYLALISGWALGVYFSERNEKVPPSFSYHGWVARLLIVLSLYFMIWGTSQNVFTLNADQKTFREEHHPKRLAPRFWQQGTIGWENENNSPSHK